MRPAPIEDEVARTRVGKRVVVGPPGGDLNSGIPPVEAIVRHLPAGLALSVRCVLEPGDIERLQAGAAVWITFLDHMVPFDVEIGL